MVPVKRI
jgi:CheY-like chemotaxis protein